MDFKADDYEKKMGTCPRHGEQILWLVCKHVGKESPKEILLGPNRVAVCSECSVMPAASIEEELIIACAACVREKIQDIGGKLTDEANIHDHVQGLNEYEAELMADD